MTPRASTLALVALAALAGCITTGPGKVRLPEPTAVLTAGVADDARALESAPLPAAVLDAVRERLAERNLEVRLAGDAGWLESVGRVRATRTRREALSAAAGEAPYQLLLETEATFYSQMNGRYRWTVVTRATLTASDSPEAAEERTFELPVFLRFDHQRERDALAEAAPLIAERVGGLADAFFAGRPTTETAP